MAEINLLNKYLDWFIDRLEPTTKDFKLKVYKSKGYIEKGSKSTDLPDFEQWLKLYKPIKDYYIHNLTKKYGN